MRAFEERMPGATILTLFHVSLLNRLATLPVAERAQRLAREALGLIPDFFVGMLEGASPKARFILARGVFPRVPRHAPVGARVGAPEATVCALDWNGGVNQNCRVHP